MKKSDKLTYSEAMEQLNTILERLNNEELDIDVLSAEVKRATELIALCRGKLTAAIIAAVSKRDKGHGERWAKLWADPMACRYRRADHADFWVWSHDFFEANVEDLRHIAALIGVGAKGARRR